MKRFKVLSLIICACVLLSSCGSKSENGENELNTNYNTGESVSLATSYSRWGINYEIADNKLTVSGEFDSDMANYVLLAVGDREDAKTVEKVNNRQFSVSVNCDSFDNEEAVNLFVGTENYGQFDGIVTDWVNVKRVGNGYEFVLSPVYEQNLDIFNEYKNPDEYLNAEASIQSDDIEIINLAESITEGITDDYDKVKAVHKWVSENIYYDYDALRSGSYENLDAKGMLMYKKGVCEGYSNITAALLRSIGIPCRIQSGFALGISTNRIWDNVNINTTESNHAWNEAYVKGRWIILDTTWDSNNRYDNGSFVKGDFTTTNYFDSTMEFFSASHKLLND